MQKLFHLKENNTNVRTEVIAGLTTFFTMAYIIFVNPSILGATGMDNSAIMFATCIAAAVGTLLMGFLANYPFALAPGMGLNAFFAFTICGSMGYSWQAGLAAVFISGVIFIIITVTGAREAIVNGIPLAIKKAISAGIGLFIALVGMKGTGLIVSNESTLIGLGDFSNPGTLLGVVCLLIAVVLTVWKVKGGLFISIIITSVIGIIMQNCGVDVGITMAASIDFNAMSSTFGQFIYGFGELFNTGAGIGVVIFSIISVLISLTLIDMFDTIGTLYGTAGKAGFLTKEGKLPRANRALLADAIATSVGAVIGTSTVTTYVESSAGVAEGGKTGLTAVVTAICFILALFLAPFLGFIPGAATYPILVVVGVMMISSVKDIDWNDMELAIPCFLTIVMMPFAYSISEGIAFGCISYTVIKLIRGKAKEIHPVMYVISILFLARYIIQYIHI